MQPTGKITGGIRVAALLLEFFMMFVIIMIFFIPAMNNDSYGLFRITHEAYKLEIFSDPWIYVSLAGLTIAFCKDCINGQSITKRIIKLQVVDNKTGAVATPMQCFIRNIPLLILPLEILVLLAQPDRRIGDKIAGTKLVFYDALKNNKPERSFKKYILPMVSAYAIFIALAFGLGRISFNKPRTPFMADSYNESKSKTLEKLLTDHFSRYYAASVKYYDSIENKKFDYVSVICTFKEDPSALHELTEQELEDQTVARVYALYPEDQVHGKIQYVYRYENSMTTWNHLFGVRFKGDEE